MSVEATGSNAVPPHVHALMAEDQAEILRLQGQVEMLQHGFRCGGQCSCLSHCPAHEDQPECDPPCCFAAAVRQRDAALAAIAKVQALHQPEACDCENCDGSGLRCPQCVGHWPCDTHLAFTAAAPLEGEGKI